MPHTDSSQSSSPTLSISLSSSSGHSVPLEDPSLSIVAPSSFSSTSTKSETHLTSTPTNPQSSNSGSSSLTGSSQPMSNSATTSSARPSLSPRPTHTVDKPVDSPPLDPKPSSMPSGGSSSRQAPPASNTRGGAGAPPSPTIATTKALNTSKSPPTSSNKPGPGPTAGGGNSSRSSSGSPASSPRTGSTTVTVVPVRASHQSTITTTITSSPETTLSAPSSVPVTDPFNGSVSLAAPPMITVLSTSTEPDGAPVTFTHLVANPTGSIETERTASGFLENQGEVAGVFTVVGVVATALFVAIVWFIRRHRRRQRRKAWFASLRQNPPSPFGSEGNQMRSIHTTSEIIHEPRMVDYHDTGYRPRSPPEESTGLGLTGIGATTGGVIVPLRRPLSGSDPFRDPPHVPQNTPVSYSPYRERFNETPGPSIAPSSPSIYPESLPPADDPPSSAGTEPKTQIRPYPEPLLRRSLSVPGHGDAPPRPPRSHLRESHKPGDIIPLTPPASVSSHGHSKPSPEIYYPGAAEHSGTRRTMLNIRPRTSLESPVSDGSRGTLGERW